MSATKLSNLAGPLVIFGEALGIPFQTWVEREELAQITYTDSEFNREIAVSLTLGQITPLLEVYGNACTCRFFLGDLPVLTINPELNEESLAYFQAETWDSPTLVLDFNLDKVQLVKNLLGEVPACNLILYIFPLALAGFLSGGLEQLESCLWDKETAGKVILLVPESDIWLDGPFLAVLGGSRLKDWHQEELHEPTNAKLVESMYHTCRHTLKWQGIQLQHLTPLHLKLEGHFLPNDSIANALRIHLANLSILYTADRTLAYDDGFWLATYASARKNVDLGIDSRRVLLEERIVSGASALLQIVEWAYDPRWSADRLALVQIVVAQELHIADPSISYQLLLHNAGRIFEELRWHWKAIIEDKMSTYTQEVRTLEDYVASVTHTFAEQVSAIIKNLSDTMLAAIAALLGSFIAALFNNKFNSTIFTLGMGVYAGYVLLFPIGYNMTHQWQRYTTLVNSFESRRRRFEERLYPPVVEKIAGEQVKLSQKLFRWWFGMTLLAYFAVLFVVLGAVKFIPKVVTSFP